MLGNIIPKLLAEYAHLVAAQVERQHRQPWHPAHSSRKQLRTGLAHLEKHGERVYDAIYSAENTFPVCLFETTYILGVECKGHFLTLITYIEWEGTVNKQNVTSPNINNQN